MKVGGWRRVRREDEKGASVVCVAALLSCEGLVCRSFESLRC